MVRSQRNTEPPTRERILGRHASFWVLGFTVLAAIAVVFLAIGIVLSVIPGPALPFFFLAGGLLASELRFVARFMDWSEVRIRKFAAWMKRHWRRLPVAGRIALFLFAACCSAATAYFGYQIITG